MRRSFLFLIIILIQFVCSFELQAASVLLIGEEHTDDFSRARLIEELPNLKKRGFNYLALEMIKDNRQPILDQFSQNPALYKEALLEILDKEWHYNTSSYFLLISRATELGFKLIALDMPRSELPQEVLPFPIIPEQSLEMAARNERMAAHIAQTVNADVGAKVLALVGEYHSLSSAIPRILEEKFNISSERLSRNSDN